MKYGDITAQIKIAPAIAKWQLLIRTLIKDNVFFTSNIRLSISWLYSFNHDDFLSCSWEGLENCSDYPKTVTKVIIGYYCYIDMKMCQRNMRCVTRKQTLRSLSLSYQKKDGRGHALRSVFSRRVSVITSHLGKP